ncbi:MAG: hypothetical protein ACHQ50_00080 [Fimbriimonadales bacterium]
MKTMLATKNRPEITITPLPDGDFEAACGAFSARGATAAEAESALLEIYQLHREMAQVHVEPPVVDEDEVEVGVSEQRVE